MIDSPVPVTLLTGFLGSGKTTILNTLLRHSDFSRTAVIVNEFGEIGLDHELVLSSTESMVLLRSGCLCCGLRGDLLETLIELAKGREAGEFDFERVVIETSGLANPAPVLHTILTSAALPERFVMDGVLVTVDAATGLNSLETHEEARRQVALADRILLTKTDLVEAEGAPLRRRITVLNPGAAVDVVVQGAIAPARLTGLGHFDLSMKSAAAQDWLAQGAGAGEDPAHLHGIRSVSWVIERPLSGTVFDVWMDLLMERRGADILRFKGLVHLNDVPFPFAVHGVQHIFHPPVPLEDWHGEDRRTKFVMILRNFTDPELEDLFEALNHVQPVEHVLPVGYLSAGAA